MRWHANHQGVSMTNLRPLLLAAAFVAAGCTTTPM
jgi:hypothetical protein